MTVTSTSLSTGVTRALIDQSTKLSAVLNNKASEVTQAKGVDASAAVAVDTTPLNKTATLRVQSVAIAFTSTKLEVLDTGATQVLRILGQLQSLASRAGLAGLSDSERTVLDGQFQALKIAINNVPPAPPGSEFKADGLLGALSGDVPVEDADAVLGGFSAEKFFGAGASTSITSEASAQNAQQVIADLSSKIAGQRETIGRLQGVTEFAAASVDAGLQNEEASQATFDDSEIGLVAVIQDQAAKVQAAQTARLPNNILQLLAQ